MMRSKLNVVQEVLKREKKKGSIKKTKIINGHIVDLTMNSKISSSKSFG